VKKTKKKKPAPKASAKTRDVKKTAKKIPKKVVAKKAALSPFKVGILGGAFNPVHAGHLNSALTVKEKLGLDKVIFIPTFNPPHREIAGPDAKNRLEMVAAAIKPYTPELEVSDLEIKRKGISYTVDTLKELGKAYKPANLFFIMGADAFKTFPKWHQFASLLKLANIVVTSRPHNSLSFQLHELPEGLGPFIKTATDKSLVLKTGREIFAVELRGHRCFSL
jgi:nicotinate-nucleotide adenylyltransferase